jgi:hypothetical protein
MRRTTGSAVTRLPRAEALSAGWNLKLIIDGQEAGGGAFPILEESPADGTTWWNNLSEGRRALAQDGQLGGTCCRLLNVPAGRSVQRCARRGRIVGRRSQVEKSFDLERRTKPFDVPPTDERACERKERLMDVCSPLMPMRNLRKRCSHLKVRSTTQRHRPSLSRDSTPYRAIRAVIPRRRTQARYARGAYARSACSLPGRFRARPQSPLTAGIALTSGIRKRESCTWVPEILVTSSNPR